MSQKNITEGHWKASLHFFLLRQSNQDVLMAVDALRRSKLGQSCSTTIAASNAGTERLEPKCCCKSRGREHVECNPKNFVDEDVAQHWNCQSMSQLTAMPFATEVRHQVSKRIVHLSGNCDIYVGANAELNVKHSQTAVTEAAAPMRCIAYDVYVFGVSHSLVKW